jgi:hypothetical protein
VQNKVALATPLLPLEVQQQGVQVNKAVRNFLIRRRPDLRGRQHVRHRPRRLQLQRAERSDQPPAGRRRDPDLRHAVRHAHLARSGQAHKIQVAGSDIIAAVKAQNAQVAAGALGDLPAMPGQLLNATIMAQSRLQTPEQFGAILLRVNTDGSRVFLRDVARVELGSETYTTYARYMASRRAGMAIRPRQVPTRLRPWPK